MFVTQDPLRFEPDGAELISGAARPIVDLFQGLLPKCADNHAGLRLQPDVHMRALLSPGSIIHAIAARYLGSVCQPVRALFLNKSAGVNWSLGWHQDRTIHVRDRIDVAGFGPWTKKRGLQHVAPPFDLLARMITVRVHLDDVTGDNGPLMVVPGSHRLGRIAATDAARIADQCRVWTCVAEAGDVWLYATPILHASHAAAVPSRRRVVQVDYSADQLPGGLQWAGI